jgi:integrase
MACPPGFEPGIGRFKEALPGLVSKINQADLDEFLSKRLETIGPARHNRDMTVLRAIFKKAVEWGYCRTNPALGIKKLTEPPGRTRFLSDEERVRLLDACSDRLRRIVEIVLDTGLRRGELLSLEWEHIDFKNRMLRIVRSKNGDRRDIPMTQRVFANLKTIPRRVDTPFIFANKDGSHFKSLKTTWGSAIRKAKIADFTFHDLRHTFASYLVMKGVDIRTVQTLMGHRSIVMTMRYSHLSATHLQKAIASLEGSASRTNQEQRGPEEKALAP